MENHIVNRANFKMFKSMMPTKNVGTCIIISSSNLQIQNKSLFHKLFTILLTGGGIFGSKMFYFIRKHKHLLVCHMSRVERKPFRVSDQSQNDVGYRLETSELGSREIVPSK